MTTIQLQREVNKALKKGNCTVSCPVSVNNRLTSTLGRAIFLRRAGKWISVRIEFSGKLLKVATDASIMEVLLHEAAHVVANYRTGRDEGHNSTFKAVCHELGTWNDKTTTKVEYKSDVKPEAVASKYSVMCPHCGIVGRYSRSCDRTKRVWRYRCGKCGNDHLSVKQNW